MEIGISGLNCKQNKNEVQAAAYSVILVPKDLTLKLCYSTKMLCYEDFGFSNWFYNKSSIFKIYTF